MRRCFVTALVVAVFAFSISGQAKDNTQKQAEKSAKKAAKQAEKAADIEFKALYNPDAPYGQAFPGVTPDQLFRAALYVAEGSSTVTFTDSRLQILTFLAIPIDVTGPGENKGSVGVQVDTQGTAHLKIYIIGPFDPAYQDLGEKIYVRGVYDFLKNNY